MGCAAGYGGWWWWEGRGGGVWGWGDGWGGESSKRAVWGVVTPDNVGKVVMVWVVTPVVVDGRKNGSRARPYASGGGAWGVLGGGWACRLAHQGHRRPPLAATRASRQAATVGEGGGGSPVRRAWAGHTPLGATSVCCCAATRPPPPPPPPTALACARVGVGATSGELGDDGRGGRGATHKPVRGGDATISGGREGRGGRGGGRGEPCTPERRPWEGQG